MLPDYNSCPNYAILDYSVAKYTKSKSSLHFAQASTIFSGHSDSFVVIKHMMISDFNMLKCLLNLDLREKSCTKGDPWQPLLDHSYKSKWIQSFLTEASKSLFFIPCMRNWPIVIAKCGLISLYPFLSYLLPHRRTRRVFHGLLWLTYIRHYVVYGLPYPL